MSVSQVIPEPRMTLNRSSHLGGDYGHRSRWWPGLSGQIDTGLPRCGAPRTGRSPWYGPGGVRTVRETAEHAQMPWSGYAAAVTEGAGCSAETAAAADDTVSETWPGVNAIPLSA